MAVLKTALSSTLSSHGKSQESIDQMLELLPFVQIKKDDAATSVSLVQRKMNRGAVSEGAACMFTFSCPNTPLIEETMYQRISRESSTFAGIRNFVKVCASQIAQMQTEDKSPKKEPEVFRFVAQSVSKESFQVKFLSGSYAYALTV